VDIVTVNHTLSQPKDRTLMRFSRRAILGGTGSSVFVAGTGRLSAQSAPEPDGFLHLEISKQMAGENAIVRYQAGVPGPILRVRQGEELRVRLLNRLAQPTTVHWHGCCVPNAMDGAIGVTQEGIKPGDSFDYRFQLTDSGTFWYHPGTFGDRLQQIAAGCFGALIVEERIPPQVHEDILLIVHDAPADQAEAGQADLFVNGTAPALTRTCAPGSRVRLRLLNASVHQVAVISFAGLKPTIAAIDGQPSDLFEPVRASIPLGPGARADVFTDLPIQPRAEARLILRRDRQPDRDLFVFTLAGEAAAPSPPLAALPSNPDLPIDINLAQAKRLDLVVDASAAFRLAAAPGSKSNESQPVAGKPIFAIKRGTPVSLGFRNLTNGLQTIHLHGHAMRLLHLLDDGWEPYWRDGFLLPAQQTSRVAFVADKPGKWVIEAADLEAAVALRYAFFEVS
jgi:FtsP/CotA-like multicopper oxidase with cupredoxin domain